MKMVIARVFKTNNKLPIFYYDVQEIQIINQIFIIKYKNTDNNLLSVSFPINEYYIELV